MSDMRSALEAARLDFHNGLDKLDREIAALSHPEAGEPTMHDAMMVAGRLRGLGVKRWREYGELEHKDVLEALRIVWPTPSAEVVAMKSLLDERDNFIVSKGLWSEFVAALPKAEADKESDGAMLVLWQLSEETKQHLAEIDRCIVRPGDLRLNQIVGGPSDPTPEVREVRDPYDRVFGLTAAAAPVDVEANYVVWSNEHCAWWGPNRCGYNTHLSHAGRYTRNEALAVCIGARGGREFNRNPSELPILLQDAEKFWPDGDLQKQHRHEAREREEEDRREELDEALNGPGLETRGK